MPHFDANSITDFHLKSRTKSPDLGNPTTFRNYKPCHRPSMPATGNADPKPLEKFQQTEPQPTRKGRTTRAKHGLTPRPRMLQTRRAILGIRPPPPAPIEQHQYLRNSKATFQSSLQVRGRRKTHTTRETTSHGSKPLSILQQPSHMAKDCNKAAAAKARAASATQDLSDSVATELKN